MNNQETIWIERNIATVSGYLAAHFDVVSRHDDHDARRTRFILHDRCGCEEKHFSLPWSLLNDQAGRVLLNKLKAQKVAEHIRNNTYYDWNNEAAQKPPT
jgi:hypothetical protein